MNILLIGNQHCIDKHRQTMVKYALVWNINTDRKLRPSTLLVYKYWFDIIWLYLYASFLSVSSSATRKLSSRVIWRNLRCFTCSLMSVYSPAWRIGGQTGSSTSDIRNILSLVTSVYHPNNMKPSSTMRDLEMHSGKKRWVISGLLNFIGNQLAIDSIWD